MGLSKNQIRNTAVLVVLGLFSGALMLIFCARDEGRTVESPVDSEAFRSELLEKLRICRIRPEPVLNTTKKGMPVKKGITIPLDYQCTGKSYDDFMEKLFNNVVVKRHLQNPSKYAHWGKRPYPMPLPNPSPSKQQHRRSILFMGNSHTRQVLEEYLCQYRHQILDIKPIVGSAGTLQFVEISFQNNLAIYTAFNAPHVYSKKWQDMFENIFFKRNLSTFDAIVMGSFNAYCPPYFEGVKRVWCSDILAFEKEHPEFEIDFERTRGPLLGEVAQVYAGPIVWVSQFALRGIKDHDAALSNIESLRQDQGRTNIYPIDSRSLIPELGEDECCSVSRTIVGKCVRNLTNNHRCIGANGGYPDYIAWDVNEALHDLLE